MNNKALMIWVTMVFGFFGFIVHGMNLNTELLPGAHESSSSLQSTISVKELITPRVENDKT